MSGIPNTWHQLLAAGGGCAILYNAQDRGRGGHGASFSTLVLTKDGKQVATKPDAPWYERGQKHWHVMRRSDRADRLAEAVAWMREHYGETGPWKRNRMGDYVPQRVNDAFPLRPKP